ncbi:MAG TPA: DNA methyltransferase [Bacillota bacterium]|jgi:site-specific DNA-methyltransferase (adenine-specific)|nr:MAG: Modification methylase MboII [Verrucomicrobia bacterium ADurb.Bin006]HOI38642.1 DNA methyltransferase [Bacillota bacterium]
MKPHSTPHNSELLELRDNIASQLGKQGVVILPPMDIEMSSRLLLTLGFHAQCCILDPWYNKGVGGVREDYDEFLPQLLRYVAPLSDHVFLWGFPEIVARFVRMLPEPLTLKCWLTWFYKNSPSRIRGWRSAQMTCLHLTTPKAVMHVENFLNDVQREKLQQGKLLYIPGPPSVIEESLLCGFVGRNEQTGHPSQKPLSVIEKTLLMATARGELAIDLMSGSGTTGEACMANERFAILCDISEEYTRIAEERLGVARIEVEESLLALLPSAEHRLPHEHVALPTKHPRPAVGRLQGHRNQLDLEME